MRTLLSQARYLGWPIALIATAATIILGAASYSPTTSPTVGDYLASKLVVVDSRTTEEWLSSPKKGQYKGNVAAASLALTLTKKDLKQEGLTWNDIRFFVKRCWLYSTTGADNGSLPELASYCTNQDVTRAEAKAHNDEEIARARAQGSPALVS